MPERGGVVAGGSGHEWRVRGEEGRVVQEIIGGLDGGRGWV